VAIREKLALLLLQLFSRTPLAFNQALGRGLGQLAWRLAKRLPRIARINLKLCFPDHDPEWIQRTAKSSILEMLTSLVEAPRLWRLSKSKLGERLENPVVLEEILNHYRQGHGLVVAAPHLGSWEYLGLLLAAHTKITHLYRPPRMESLNDFIKQGRKHLGAQLVPTDSSGVRALSKALSKGECIGILPDQEPEPGSGEYTHFFGQSAYTMYLLPRLVRKRKTPVVFAYAERLKQGRFRLHCEWADTDLYSTNVKTACQSMNQHIEHLVIQSPEQYNWSYKRFRTQADGTQVYR
jgi:KDO2-lipid IV(A) lauroyltransferase